jgi:hypothetical protein
MLRAMVFAIISSGYHPRCALDLTDGADIRVDKIARMIGECDWGIHDLSRVEVVGGAPRFNMPMELGLHLGARLLGAGRHRRKRALILDAKPHRYDATLSDHWQAAVVLPKNIGLTVAVEFGRCDCMPRGSRIGERSTS